MISTLRPRAGQNNKGLSQPRNLKDLFPASKNILSQLCYKYSYTVLGRMKKLHGMFSVLATDKTNGKGSAVQLILSTEHSTMQFQRSMLFYT